MADNSRLLRKVEKLASDGKSDKALELLNSELSKSPREYDLIHQQADILFNLLNEREALRAINKAWNSHPNRRPELIAYLEQIKLRYPDLNEIDIFIVDKYLNQGDLAAARDVVSKLDTTRMEKLSAQYQAKVSRLQRTAIPGSLGGADTVPFYGLITLLEIARQWDQAAKLITTLAALADRELTKLDQETKRLIDAHPDVVSLHQTQAQLHFSLLNWDDLVRQASFLVDQDETDLDTLEELLKKALRQIPTNWRLKEVLSRLFVKKRQFKPAFDLLRDIGLNHTEARARAIDFLYQLELPEEQQPPLRQTLAELHLLENQSRRAAEEFLYLIENFTVFNEFVIERCRTILKKEPSAFELNLPLADAYVHIGQTESGIKSYLVLAEKSTDHIPIVIERLTALLEKNPAHISTHKALANLLSLDQKYHEAVIVLHHLFMIDHSLKNEVIRFLNGLLKRCDLSTEINFRCIQIHLDSGDLHSALAHIKAIDDLTIDMLDQILIEVDYYCCQHPADGEAIVDYYRDWLTLYVDHAPLRLALGRIYFYQGKLEEAAVLYKQTAMLDENRAGYAVDALQEILDHKPNYFAALRELLEVYLEFDHIEGAAHTLEIIEQNNLLPLKDIVTYFYKILDKYPTHTTLRLAFARTYQRNELLQHTIRCCDEAIEILPEEELAEFYLIKAECQSKEHELKPATENFNRAYRLNRNLADTVTRGLTEILTQDPEDRLARRFLADVYRQDGNTERAIAEYLYLVRIDQTSRDEVAAIFREITDQDDLSAMAWLGAGDLAVILEKDEQAIISYQKAWQLDQELLEKFPARYEQMIRREGTPGITFVAYSAVLIRLQRFDEVIRHLTKALELDAELESNAIGLLREILNQSPQRSDARRMLIDIYIARSAFEEATDLMFELLQYEKNDAEFVLDQVQPLLEQDPQHIKGRWARARAKVVREDFATAIEEILEIIEIDPRELDRALKYSLEIKQVHPDLIPWQFLQGDLFFLNGNYPQAREQYWQIAQNSADHTPAVIERFDRMIKADSQNASLYLLQGELYLKRGELEPAIEMLTTGIKHVHGGDLLVELHVNRGYAFLLNGEADKARAEFKKARKFDPQQKIIYRKIRQLWKTGLEFQLQKHTAASPEKARLQTQLQQYTNALATWQEIPGNEAKIARLSVLVRQGQLDLAVESGLALDALDQTGLAEMAQAYHRMGNVPAEIACLKQILKDNPSNTSHRKLQDRYKTMVLQKLQKKGSILVSRTKLP